MGFINRFCHSRPFEDILDPDVAQNENGFTTSALGTSTEIRFDH